MDNDHGITGELREWASRNLYLKAKFEELTVIADRIDAAHEEALREAYTKGCEDGMGMANAKDAQAEYLRGKNDGYDEGWDAGFASADDWLGQHEDAMAEHGWVRLPVDGEAPCKQLEEWIEKRGLITGPLDHDGELWHKGDMSASPWGEIASIVFDGQCWQVCGHDTSAPWLPADSLLHYHAPTVEDVLREFFSRYVTTKSKDEDDAIIAEYATKLRLAGDAE